MPIDISTNAIIEKNKLTSTNVELLLLEFVYKTETPFRVCLNNAEITWNSNTWYPAVFSLTGMDETKEGEIPKVSLNFFDLNSVIIPIIEETDGLPDTTVNIYIVDSLYLSDTTPKFSVTATISSIVVNDNKLITLHLGTSNLSLLRIPKNRYLKNHCRFNFKEVTAYYITGGTSELISGLYVKGQTTNATGVITRIVHSGGTWSARTASGFLLLNVISGTFAPSSNEAIKAYTDSGFTTLYQAANIATFKTPVQGLCNYSGAEISCNRSYARCVELNNETRYGGFPGIGKTGVYK
jgi:phage-related protein